jgi:hypothetical protein
MKLLMTIAILTLAINALQDESLKTILKDGRFAKLPDTANTIGHEVVVDKHTRFGYLAFQAPKEDIAKWIEDSNLLLAHKVDLFEKDISVRKTNRPTWFEDSTKKFMITEDLFYSTRETDEFVIVGWVNFHGTVIHLEYEIRL